MIQETLPLFPEFFQRKINPKFLKSTTSEIKNKIVYVRFAMEAKSSIFVRYVFANFRTNALFSEVFLEISFGNKRKS